MNFLKKYFITAMIIFLFIFLSFFGLIFHVPHQANSQGEIGRAFYGRSVYIDASGGIVATGLIQNGGYHWVEEFDDEAAGVEFESGLVADFWTTAGDNYAASQVVYANIPGGAITLTPDGSDDASNNLLGLPHWRVNNDPIFEVTFKVDDASDCAIAMGFAGAASTTILTPDNDVCLIYINHEPAGAGEGLSLCLWCADNNTDVTNDLGVDITDDTYITAKVDLTDTEQPRVWVDGTEIDPALITGTVQAGETLYPFVLVEDLAVNAPVVTLKKFEAWQRII